MLGYGDLFCFRLRRIDNGVRDHRAYDARMPSPHLERKLKEVLGEDAGQELAAVTDRIDPVRGDIAELRHIVEQGFTTTRDHIRFVFVVLALLLAAIVGLYGTLVALVR